VIVKIRAQSIILHQQFTSHTYAIDVIQQP